MTIKTIAHIADLHFRNFQRHDEFRAVCNNFLYHLKEINPERLVITGDLVHSRNQLTPELVNEVSWFLKECSDRCGKVIIIPGNHDIVEQNKERMDAITPIVKTLDIKNIVYYKNSQAVIDENVVWIVYSIYDNNMAPDYSSEEYKDYVKIGLFHGIVNGMTNDFGFKFNYGADVNKFNICDIVLCGDIHKRNILYTMNKNKINVPIIMVGSFLQQDYGETVSQHGYNVVEINDGQITHQFHDIENPVKYLTFKISDITDIESNKEILLNA